MNGYEHLGILFHLNADDGKTFDGIVDVPYMCGKYRKSSHQELAKLKNKKHIKKLFLWYGGTAFDVN